jgi:hypothetical protein
MRQYRAIPGNSGERTLSLVRLCVRCRGCGGSVGDGRALTTDADRKGSRNQPPPPPPDAHRTSREQCCLNACSIHNRTSSFW